MEEQENIILEQEKIIKEEMDNINNIDYSNYNLLSINDIAKDSG